MDALDGLPNKNPQPNTLAELDFCAMAWAEGLEPPTVGLENRCSIQLSYTHIDMPKLVKELELARKSSNGNQVSGLRICRLDKFGNPLFPSAFYCSYCERL